MDLTLEKNEMQSSSLRKSIQILAPEIIDQIAAGEVVERPAHLVKELVENSLDAGATEISVEYSQGGRIVKVSDNGSGILPEDLRLACLRHATSKIKCGEDLFHLRSFGFRGEALSAISGVSRLTLWSATEPTGTGARVICEFGQIKDLENVNRPQGTTVLVEDLFANVPARLKFMKSEAAEHSQIKGVVKAMALARPEVSFRVMQEGKPVALLPKVKAWKQRVEQVLEVQPLYEGSAERGTMRARAFFADPNTTGKTSKQVYIFAQGRWIQDRGLQAAIQESYRQLLMHGEYPIAAVFVECDPEEIDVNIHPTKSQVKFLQPSEAFRVVQAALRKTLEGAPWIAQLKENHFQGIEGRTTTLQFEGCSSSPQGNSLGIKTDPTELSAATSENTLSPIFREPIHQMTFSDPDLDRTEYFKKTDWVTQGEALNVKPYEAENIYRSTFVKAPLAELSPTNFLKDGQPTTQSGFWSRLDVIGQAGLTYIVCQTDLGLIFVDQHAAHERIAFERLMSFWTGKDISLQQYLIPLTIDLNEDRKKALLSVADDLLRLGIEIEEYGPETIGVKAAPLILKESAIHEELEKLATEILECGGSYRIEKFLGDHLATLACHSVIRAGQSLSLREMKSLLEEMDEFPLSSFCPHGRPVYVEYRWDEVEKDFARK